VQQPAAAAVGVPHSVAFCCHQVHEGNTRAAADATKKLEWKQMITLSVEIIKMPLMWYFSIAAFLWGESVVVLSRVWLPSM
jgi:hypothetical protein